MLVVVYFLRRHGRIRYLLLVQLKPEHQGFKATATTRELNISGHQKHELRRRLQSGTGPAV